MPDEFNDLSPRYSHRRMMQEIERARDSAYVAATKAVMSAPSLDENGQIAEKQAILIEIAKAARR
jgi:hypothetical protein